jgi:aminopeptidase N
MPSRCPLNRPLPAARQAGRRPPRRKANMPAAGSTPPLLPPGSTMPCGRAPTDTGASLSHGRLLALGAHLLRGSPQHGPACAKPTAMDTASAPKEVFRKDYRPPDYLIPAVSLHFALGVGAEPTIVTASLSCERASGGGGGPPPLVLDGEGLELLSLAIDGVAVPTAAYRITSETNASTTLTINGAQLPSSAPSFTVTTTVRIFPESNQQGDGLYLSNKTFCTQCEPQGFRRITFNQDRPDVLSVYTVTVEGDAESCPVLLSNGNRVVAGEAEGAGRHCATFVDPFPKPTYLFALVAGDLGCLQDSFITESGREVQLGIFTEHANVHRTQFAMACLKNCMKWDEDKFGLEYDLDAFNIVAVSHFGGAMENKSLNIFSAGLVVATPESTTVSDSCPVSAQAASLCLPLPDIRSLLRGRW